MLDKVKIKNSEASFTISNFKCVEDEWKDHPKIHISFDVNFKSQEYEFSVNFSEMFYGQFDFKRGVNQIVDECHQEKILIIKKDEISLQVKQEANDKLMNINLEYTIKVDEDKIENFKIELKSWIEYVLNK